MEKTQKKQEETKLHEKPVLLVRDIEYRQAKLERELLFLLNKAKYYVPKPKPKAENTTGMLKEWYINILLEVI